MYIPLCSFIFTSYHKEEVPEVLVKGKWCYKPIIYNFWTADYLDKRRGFFESLSTKAKQIPKSGFLF